MSGIKDTNRSCDPRGVVINNHRHQDSAPLNGDPLSRKAESLLTEHRLQIAKGWLAKIIDEIEDLATLESFPTQTSIRASVDVLEGLATALHDDRALIEFEPGGLYYEKSATLGLVGSGRSSDLMAVARSMQALEDSIWEMMIGAFRRDDRDLLRLIMRLRRALTGVSMAAAEACYARANSELDRMAHTDALTDLFNRRYLMRELERHVEIFKRYHHPFSIIMLDVDNLKWLNDTYGHATGDAALRHIATLMRNSIRDVDFACRYGGDEFVILMPETEKRVVEIVAERISASLQKTKLKIDHSLLTLEVTVGSASCPEDGTDSEHLLQEADASLYRLKAAKNRGGNVTAGGQLTG
ncbi:MAG: GGDEF domain-containing protein [Actinobacteria bacterium]|nr:GGDEF domain-containing protein [Actinomycetota bacterium]